MPHGFFEISPEEISGNIFKKIGKDKMLITADARDGKPNPMTASWGCAGVLWNKPVAVVFLRPQRYTAGLVNTSGKLSLSFFRGESEAYTDGKYRDVFNSVRSRDVLAYCGSHSGRDGDKFAAAGITPKYEDGIPYVAEADTVMLCHVLYRSAIDEADFIDDTLLDNYKNRDYHYVYICEIDKVLKKE